MKWITSLDELLFELMSWLVFWPVTLVRAAFTPLAMMRYSLAQTARPEEEQYGEALSPPVFLILTLVILHLAGLALGQSDAILDNQHGVARVVTSDTSAVAVRLVLFAAFPLLFSVALLVAQRRVLSRVNLQQPFYAQCYPAAVFAGVLAIAAQLAMLKIGPAGLTAALMGLAAVWLLVVETVWFVREHGLGWLRALAMALGALIVGIAIVLGMATLLLNRFG